MENTSKSPQNNSSIDNDNQILQNNTQQSTNHNLSQSKKVIKKKKTNLNSLVANLADTKYPVVKRVLKNQLKFKIIKQIQVQEWDLFWTDNAVQPEQLAKLKPYQKINHFPGMYSLSRKNYLARNLYKMSKQFPNDYSFYPQTWILPSELNVLKKYMQSDPNCILIAKPEASSQGRGIFLTKSADDFQFGQHYVVQKYLKKPLLIDNLKFDLRIYVLVAGCDPLRVYIYKQGLARFATESYSLPKKENMKNLFMHLTNYAINKNSQKFKFNTSQTEMDQGHKRSLTSVLNYLQKSGHNVKKLWKQIKQIILKTLISVQPILSHHYRSCQPQNYSNNMCFQILGFDVIIDQKLSPSILQVNYTPSFTTDTPLDQNIKENLIKDAIILMNITQKTKNQLINKKNKQMKQRVLTGKKLFLSKEQKNQQIQFYQKLRDVWQNSHLGNFQKVYPFEPQFCTQQKINQLNKNYKQFLQYSEKCYHEGTGTNIKRNVKVVKPLNLVEKKSQQKIQNKPEINKQLRQIKNNLRTNELQKIYRSKFRPIPIRNKNSSKLQNKDKSIYQQSDKKQQNKEQKAKEIKLSVNNIEVQHNYLQFEKFESSVTKNPILHTTHKFQRSQKSKNNVKGVRTVNSIKIQPKNTIYNNKNIFKRPQSAANNKSVSTIYNITFKQISLKKNQ